jgi:hypothetical protein
VLIDELIERPALDIRQAAEETLHCRQIDLKPDTCDENTRSVEAVLATDQPVTSVDSRTGKGNPSSLADGRRRIRRQRAAG